MILDHPTEGYSFPLSKASFNLSNKLGILAIDLKRRYIVLFIVPVSIVEIFILIITCHSRQWRKSQTPHGTFSIPARGCLVQPKSTKIGVLVWMYQLYFTLSLTSSWHWRTHLKARFNCFILTDIGLTLKGNPAHAAILVGRFFGLVGLVLGTSPCTLRGIAINDIKGKFHMPAHVIDTFEPIGDLTWSWILWGAKVACDIDWPVDLHWPVDLDWPVDLVWPVVLDWPVDILNTSKSILATVRSTQVHVPLKASQMALERGFYQCTDHSFRRNSKQVQIIFYSTLSIWLMKSLMAFWTLLCAASAISALQIFEDHLISALHTFNGRS